MAMPERGRRPAAAAVHLPRGRRADPAPRSRPSGVHVTYGGGAGGAPVEYRWDGDGLGALPGRHAARRRGGPAGARRRTSSSSSSTTRPPTSTDQFGVPIPEAQLVGEGEAWVLTGGGRRREGPVEQADARRGHHLHRRRRQPDRLTPGSTWVALPAAGRRRPACCSAGVRAAGHRRRPPVRSEPWPTPLLVPSATTPAPPG